MCYVLLVLLLIQPLQCARILAIFPSPFRSHHLAFQPLWHQLAINGHQVTVITPEPIKNNTLINLIQIDISFTYRHYFEQLQMQETFNTQTNFFKFLVKLSAAMGDLTRSQMQHPEVQKLISGDNRYDLMIVEIHDTAWFALARKYNCLIIGMTSMGGGATNHVKRLMGNIVNPVFTPYVDLRFGSDLTLSQRVFSVLFELFDDLWRGYVNYPTQQKIATEALDDPTINLREILTHNLSLLFTIAIPGLHDSVINLPAVIPLHGLQVKPPGTLPEDLQQLLDASPKGVIYFSLGSIVKSNLLSPSKLSMFLKVFAKLPYRFIWKFEEKITGLPPNVKVVTWAPQQDILRHRNTKLFMTHGGQQSVEEAVSFRVPMLCFPFFGDHFFNVKTVQQRKIGTWLDFESLTEQTLTHAILETINNDTYMKNLEQISDLQRESGGLDTAMWWVEYVLKHNGAPQLRSSLLDVPFYQQCLVDVILFLTVCLVILAVILKELLTIVLHKCFRRKLKIS